MEEEVEGEVVVVDGRVRCGGDNDSGEVQFYYYEDDSHSSLWEEENEDWMTVTPSGLTIDTE